MAEKEVKLTRHHRRPTSIGGSQQDWNISMLPEKQHKAWHLLFANMAAFDIALLINEKFLDTHFVLEVNLRRKK